ncbi:phage head closure protein [Paracoccus haeundaensis]|uniref:Head-tail adaptor protein n=1 Tax=Paracoccus haeundaensis TaxID=225362 RepID=A0A5C4RBD2_9RHOB|nr:phage head closure protein [Paracoccus haeundaensis]TNH41276.1 head-tail adaptor protein [Paracoccus haeundaensis]
MKAGRLTETIQMERGDAGINDYGTPTTVWQRYATVRAERIDQTTEEFMRAGGASDEETVVFRIRHVEGVGNADRVLWKGEAFNIQQVTPIGRRQGQDLRCTRLSHEGD